MVLLTIISEIVRKDNTFPDYLRKKKTFFFQIFLIKRKLFIKTYPLISFRIIGFHKRNAYKKLSANVFL